MFIKKEHTKLKAHQFCNVTTFIGSLLLKVFILHVLHFVTYIDVLNFQRKLEGYKFPVYTTAFCPRIQTEWTERSSALKCNKSNGYMCIPNESIDQLVEFCYREPVERVQKG